MYIGSVRFFKHLLLLAIALMIIVPTIGCIHFAVQCSHLKAELASLHPEFSNSDGFSGNQGMPGYDQSWPAMNIEETGALYESKYPHMYVENNFQYVAELEKTVYLTFDYGPTELTPQVLDILRDNGIHATFFVVYRQGDEAKALYNRIASDGHTIAILPATNDYQLTYGSVESFLDNFTLLSDMIEREAGVKPEIFRFPNGSVNYNFKDIRVDLINEMLRRGYMYYDWDVTVGYLDSTATQSSIYTAVIDGVLGRSRAIVQMYDAGTPATITALPDIIAMLRDSGYEFGVLNKNIQPTWFDNTN